MGDLYNRLREIRSRKPAAEKRRVHLQPPGGAWTPIAEGAYRRTTEHEIDIGRWGDRFTSDGRWQTLSPVTGHDDHRTPLFLDIETNGLSGGAGTIAFLIGIAFPIAPGRLTLEQFFLGDPAGERALIAALVDAIAAVPRPLYVTYNGGSFDLPVLRSRCVINRTPFPEEAHWDVLHTIRRLYSGTIGNCSLGNVESAVLKRPRLEDVSGQEAPERYQRYLSTGQIDEVRPVWTHHERDIVHLAEVALLANAILSGVWDGEVREDGTSREGTPMMPDGIALAKTLIRRGGEAERRRAERIVERVCVATERQRMALRAFARSRRFPMRPGAAWIEARTVGARLSRERGDMEQYRALLEQLADVAARKVDVEAYAKLLEHHDGNYIHAAAIIEDWCRRNAWDEELRHRFRRLQRRLSRRTIVHTVQWSGTARNHGS